MRSVIKTEEQLSELPHPAGPLAAGTLAAGTLAAEQMAEQRAARGGHVGAVGRTRHAANRRPTARRNGDRERI